MPGAAPPGADRRRGLDGTLGLAVLDSGPGSARGRLVVDDRVRQDDGSLHGAAYAALAESLCTRSTAEAVSGERLSASASSTRTSVLRTVSAGVVEAVATRRHRGRRSWVWEVEFTDAERRLCALARVTVAVG